MLKAYKYRIYPNKEQEILINKSIGSCRFVFNHYLNERINSYKNNQKSLSYNDNANDLKNLKKEYEWLKEVDSRSLQNKLRKAHSFRCGSFSQESAKFLARAEVHNIKFLGVKSVDDGKVVYMQII